MKHIAVLLAGVALLSIPARAADNDGMTPAISQCLHDNAAAVEAAEPDLTKATDYLVSSACAAPIADEQHRMNVVRTQQMAERNRAQCLDRVAQQKSQETISPAPRRIYENCELNYNNLIANGNFPVLFGIGIGARPAAAISLAAKLILDLRLAHNKSRP